MPRSSCAGSESAYSSRVESDAPDEDIRVDIRVMERRGARYGLETMCLGGGQGITAIFERV